MKRIFSALIAMVLVGCGSGTNNDQGVTFSFLGYYESSGGAPVGQLTTPLTVDSSEGVTDDSDGTEGEAITFLGFKNNLSGQGLRLQRVFFSYFVPGAMIQPPDTSAAQSLLLGPGAAIPGVVTSLPPGFGSGLTATQYVATSVIPPQIREWINLHRTELPEAPFDMEVIAFARGITTAGDSVETNSASLMVRFLPDNLINPTDGEETEEESADTGDAEAAGLEALERVILGDETR